MRFRTICTTSFFLSILFVLIFGGYTFFKDLDGPEIILPDNSGRISQNAVLSIIL